MGAMQRNWLGVGVAAGLVMACGGDAEDASSGDGDGSSSGGSSGDGDLGSGGAGDGDLGSGGSGDGDLGSGGNGGSVACTGTFGPATVFLVDTRPSTPALTSDELELFYANGPSGEEQIKRSVRATVTEPFSAGEPVAELNSVCPEPRDLAIDISEDGLRAYLACYNPDEIFDANHPVYFAERPSRDAAFGPTEVMGSFATSAALSANELMLVGTTYGAASTDFVTRSGLGEPFGSRMALAGLENTALFAPTISPDGLEVYGAMQNVVHVTTRPSIDTPFGTPTPLDLLPAGFIATGAPELSVDCKKLIVVGVDEEGNYALYQAVR